MPAFTASLKNRGLKPLEAVDHAETEGDNNEAEQEEVSDSNTGDDD